MFGTRATLLAFGHVFILALTTFLSTLLALATFTLTLALSVHTWSIDESSYASSSVGSLPPGFSEVLQPGLLGGSILQNSTEGWALWPSSRVAVTSSVRTLARAASVSEVTSSRGDVGSTVVISGAILKNTIVEESIWLSPSAALSVRGVKENTSILQGSALSLRLA